MGYYYAGYSATLSCIGDESRYFYVSGLPPFDVVDFEKFSCYDTDANYRSILNCGLAESSLVPPSFDASSSAVAGGRYFLRMPRRC
jgi:hypothetical protein